MSGPTNGLTGSAATLIAVAGGSGAFLGAVVGQAIQWWRDAVKTKIEDRRRMEDRADAFNREQRESKRDIYDRVAFQLEEIITALDWYSFSEYSDDRPTRNLTSEQTNQLHSRRWEELWGVLSEARKPSGGS
jgi:hypothetical protein